jgi:hypothetical protein
MTRPTWTTMALLCSAVVLTTAALPQNAPPPCLISSNFNGTPIAGGQPVWFNSVFSLPGFDASRLTKPLTISFTGVKITFTANSTPYTITAPNASITYDPAATTATTTFTPGTPGQWTTTLPTTHLAGNNFLDGVEFLAPASGLPGGVQLVTWTGTFLSSATGLNVQWQWGAAVYTNFSTDYTKLGVKPVDDNQASSYKNSDHAGTPEYFTAYVTGGATGGGGSNFTGSYSGTGSCTAGTLVPTGSCQGSSSLTTLVTGRNVIGYVPKGNWSITPATGISVVNIEGTSITPTKVTTPNVVNSCAANSLTRQTVCTANNADVYLLTGTAIINTLSSSGTGTIRFSGGICTNCGVAMDAIHNKAAIGLSVGGAPGFQILDLGTQTFEPAFTSPAGRVSEDPLYDPIRNLLLSATETRDYEIIDLTNSTAPKFYENRGIASTGGLDSSAEECSTGIALAPGETFSGPSQVFIADLTQATVTAGSPGTWSAPSQVQTLTESFLPAGGRSSAVGGSAVAQGTHIGIISGEFGGNAITAIVLPATSGNGIPAISDWVTCGISPTFSNGYDPHTLAAYQSPNTGDAMAVLVDGGAFTAAVVDLSQMLDPTKVPRTTGPGLGHACVSGYLPSTVVSFVSVP